MKEKTSRDIQSEMTRENIVEAATMLFHKKGFFATSIADIAKSSGLTKGALYHHFKSKEDIFIHVIKSIKNAWLINVGKKVVMENDPLESLDKLLENHALFLNKNDFYCIVLNGLIHELDSVNTEFFNIVQSAYSDLAEFIKKILEKGQLAGKLRNDIDPEITALSIVGMLRGTGCARPVSEKMKYDYVATMDVLRKIIIKGLQ